MTEREQQNRPLEIRLNALRGVVEKNGCTLSQQMIENLRFATPGEQLVDNEWGFTVVVCKDGEFEYKDSHDY